MEAPVVKSAPVGNGALAGFQPQLGAKRLVIQNLRKVTDAQSQIGQYYDRTQRELGDALKVLLASGKPSIPLERLYRGVEDLCRAGKAERLHALLKSSIEHHLQGPVLSRLRRNGTGSNEQMLSAVLEEWTVLNKQTVRLLLFLDFTSHES
jgi:cullin-4